MSDLVIVVVWTVWFGHGAARRLVDLEPVRLQARLHVDTSTQAGTLAHRILALGFDLTRLDAIEGRPSQPACWRTIRTDRCARSR